MLIDGAWTSDWQPVQATDAEGGFVRQVSSFRNWVTPEGSPGPTGTGGFKAEAGRYHLYVALICPWASRTLIARRLKGLDEIISLSIVDPRLSEQGWRFDGYPGATPDHINGRTFLHEISTSADRRFTGRATVPLLWDKELATIVSNESADILRMMNAGFGDLADPTVDLYPEPFCAEIDRWNERLYPSLNNGVYRAGFATTQGAYETAFNEVFEALDEVEAHLTTRRFLVSDDLTEADIRLFVTLIRFDVAYHGLFKCNLRRIADYPAIAAYTRRMLSIPAIRETVDIDHIKQGYYAIKALNPTGIVPIGPGKIA